jgi:hypothetical protein
MQAPPPRYERIDRCCCRASTLQSQSTVNNSRYSQDRPLDFGDLVTERPLAARALKMLWLFAVFWHLSTVTWWH